MTTLSDTELARAAWYGFGDLGQNNVVIMTAIALAESNGQTDALSPGAKSGGAGAFGLWQIENNHPEFGPTFFTAQYKVPQANVLAARSIYDSQHFEGWSAYTDGRYKQYISRAQAAVQATQGTQSFNTTGASIGQMLDSVLGITSGSGAGNGPSGTIAPNFADNNGQQGYPTSLGGIFTGNNSVGSFLTGMGPVLWIATGGLLVILAIVMLAKDETNPATLAKMAVVA